MKCLWGAGWDDLIARDHSGKLVAKLEGTVDGEFQRLSTAPGSVIREQFFGPDPELRELVKDLSDTEIEKLRRGGHDPQKVYAAYKTAAERNGRPTVVLAQTIKGYGLGEAGEGKMVAHNAKKMSGEQLKAFRDRFRVPVSDKECEQAPFYKPDPDSEEMRYLHARREELGGFLPKRMAEHDKLTVPPREKFKKYFEGSGGKEASTTFVLGSLMTDLLRDKNLGERVVPIIPDEARTFGFEGLFKQVGIYAPKGQLYEPVDRAQLMYYREAKDGQLLEEGINEAGAMSSFIAAGNGVRERRHADDPVLRLLQHVRLPAGRRPDLAGRGFAVQGLFVRRDERPDDPQRRGPPAPGRAQPAGRLDGPQHPRLRPGL